MVIPDQTITGVSGLGANAPGVLRRTAEPIPDQLKFSATIDPTPIRWLAAYCVGGLFSRRPFPAYLSTSRHTIIGGKR